jgi:hypothetical protein
MTEMGADLIGVGYTLDTSKAPLDLEAFTQYLGGLTDEELHSPDWDELEYVEYRTETADDVREVLLGAAQGLHDLGNSRLAQSWVVGQGPHEFFFVGAATWGDDPFDGYDETVFLFGFLTAHPKARALTNFVGWGVKPQLTYTQTPELDTLHPGA